MITTLIIEDEKPAARRLKKLLSEFNLDILATLHAVSEAKKWFSNNAQPQLIFLDIQLSDGLSFEIFEDITLKSAIIFTTAYDEYALKAFKLNSIDYLLKPIDKIELKAAIEKFKTQRLETTNDLNYIKNLFLNNLNKNEYKERFTVKVGEQLKLFNVKEIQCFYSQDKANYLLAENGRSYAIDFSLEEIIAQLNPKLFFKISRKFIININAVQKIVSYSNSRLRIVLKTEVDQIPIVSREKVKDFKTWLDQ